MSQLREVASGWLSGGMAGRSMVCMFRAYTSLISIHLTLCLLSRGVHPPLDHDASPPCFRFAPIFEKNFRLCGKFSQFYLFPKNFAIFIRQKFLMTFFSHRQPMSNSPYFPCFSAFPPVSQKLLFPPTLKISAPLL